MEDWPSGHLKLAWTRHLLKLRSECSEVFAAGDYRPMQVSGRHRDHVVAFARRRGRDAAIVVVAKSCAAFSQGGRTWPRAEAFEGALDIKGYTSEAGNNELQLSALFKYLPVAVLKAKIAGASKPAPRRGQA